MNDTTNAASNQQLEPCPFCGVVPTMQSHTQEDEMDDGRYVFLVECGNGKCPMGLVSTGGPYRSQADAAKRWNSRSRVSEGGVVATVDQMWEALKAACCKNPTEAKLAVFVSEKKFKEALAPFAATASPAAPKEAAPCANCLHTDPHNGPAGTVDDACTHRGCNCGYYQPATTTSPNTTREAAEEIVGLERVNADRVEAVIRRNCFPD